MIEIEVKKFPAELSFDKGYRCLLSEKARNELNIKIGKLHSTVLKIIYRRKVIYLRVFQGKEEDANKSVIYFNPFVRDYLMVNVGDVISAKIASNFKHFWFWIYTEHRSELLVGIITGIISGIFLKIILLK